MQHRQPPRPPRDEQLRLPAPLAALLEREGRDAQELELRLERTGVTALEPTWAGDLPTEIVSRSPRLRGEARVDRKAERPVTTAIEALADRLEIADEFIRLRLAAADMAVAAVAANKLAAHRSGVGSGLGPVEDVLEAGLIVVYARSFTGNAELDAKWHPTGEDADLHHRLMVLRHSVHAHADHTAVRTLVDTRLMLGLEGPPAFAVTWQRLPPSTLEMIADLCRRLERKYRTAADKLEPKTVGVSIESLSADV